MNKAHILKLLNEQASIQSKLDYLKTSIQFDENTVRERASLSIKLVRLKSELSAYTPEQIDLAQQSKEKAQIFIKKHAQEDEQELVLVDNSMTRFLMYALLLQNTKPENKLFLALAINTFFGDKYEKKFKR
ncbi:hypothetical protein [Burkholderia cenocepacia]|uniref:hypothetical protein n=1 Tax=Burkholderia cenocepacia TaxID=95486 RepID=UPI001BA364F8|nr:hypothetical protein [Burkholderia cenocepacia]MBR7905818.1 hypothetical protein [Burkholderia cenocepacia]MBR8426608.1 hypothetical protein [Burkholderia cenocepacia]